MQFIERQVEFLCARRFPDYFEIKDTAEDIENLPDFEPSDGPELNSFANFIREKKARLIEIEQYENELWLLSDADRHSKCEQEFAKVKAEALEENDRIEKDHFWHKSHAFADFVHWSKMPNWSIDAGIALLLGRSPDVVTWDSLRYYTATGGPLDSVFRELFGRDIPRFRSQFAEKFAQLRSLALSHVDAKLLTEPVTPRAFLEWARKFDVTAPQELEKLVARYWGTEGASEKRGGEDDDDVKHSDQYTKALTTNDLTQTPPKWWHEYEPLAMAEKIADRMRKNGDFVATGKDAGKLSAVRIYKEIAADISLREKWNSAKTGQQAKPISYKSIESYLKEKGFSPNR